MNVLEEYRKKNSFFYDITGISMLIHRKYMPGLLESAYEAALKYLLEQKGYTVKRQVYLPIYWENVKLDQTYRIDLLVNDNIILELKSVSHIETCHRRQLWSYMNITHIPFGMLINFGSESLFSEWYSRDDESGKIEKINNKL